jgi:hypothetical protein
MQSLKTIYMKGKYITTQILLACLSHNKVKQKDIHAQLKETIVERKRILQQSPKLFTSWLSPQEKDIYAQLLETLLERKRILEKLQRTFSSGTKILPMDDSRAA